MGKETPLGLGTIPRGAEESLPGQEASSSSRRCGRTGRRRYDLLACASGAAWGGPACPQEVRERIG